MLAAFMGPHLAGCPCDRIDSCTCTDEPPIVFFYKAADGSGYVPWRPGEPQPQEPASA